MKSSSGASGANWPRLAVSVVLAGRVAYGLGLLAAPERLGSAWLGPAAAGSPVQVPLRGLGAREVILHSAALGATWTGRPVVGWLAASIAGDLADITATAVGRRELPVGAAGKTLLVAGGSAAISAAVAAVVGH